jgi:Cu-processing system permease protein
MNATVSIAVNTFKETIRNKVLYNILFVAIGTILFSVFVGDWSVFARAQVMQDFGLAAMSVTSLLLAVFIGVGMLGREIASKTVYTVVSKSVGRSEFVIGKFLGLVCTLLLNCFLISLVLWIAIKIATGRPQPLLFAAMVLVWVEMAMVVAAAILFSAFTSPTLSAIFTVAFWVIGHWNDTPTLKAADTYMAWASPLLKALSAILPNLEHFNIRTAAVYGLPLPQGYMWYALAYGGLYTVFLLLVACLKFRTKDL